MGLATEAAAQTVPTLKVEIPTVTEGETGKIKLTLSQAPSQSFDTSVSGIAVASCAGVCPQGTAAAGTNDYSFPSTVITFAPGETTKTVSFTTTDDSATESTEVFEFFISGLAASEATIDSTTPADSTFSGRGYAWFVRIQDNDNPASPNVTIAPGTSPVTEGTSATFTVTATPAPTAATSVSVVVTEDTSGGQDFVASSNETTHTVSIPASGSPGAGTATLTIPTVSDSTQEPNGAVTATVSGGTGYTVGSPSSATVTVNDGGTTPPPNTAPTVDNIIPNQTATVGTAFSFQFPANTFSDADSDSLTYTAAKSDGTALPSWLTFTAVTRTFSGTPQAAHVGTLSVKVTANDGNSGTVSDTFDIVVSAAANNAPRVANAIPNQTATAGTGFSFQFPANTFSDADSDSLTYTAAKSDDTALPSWLTFTAVTRTFSGTPQAAHAGTLSVKVTANDGNSGTVSDTFDIVVSNAAPTTPTITIAGGSAVTEGTAASFTLTASPAPSASLSVKLTVAQSGSFVASGHLGSSKTVSIGTSGTATYTVPTQADTTDEPNGSVTVTVNTGTGYTVGSPSSATVTVNDNDGTESVVTIKGGHEVREGRGAAFTLTASPAPTWDQAVNISVTESRSGVTPGGPGTRTVTIPANKTSHTFTVATVNDPPLRRGGTGVDGTVTATVDTGTGYTLGSPSSATVSILDDDKNAASGNYIRVWGRGASIQNEDDRGTRHFQVSRFGLPTATTGDWGFKLCFAGTATPGVDYTLDTHFREEAGVAIGADGCTAQRTIPGGDDRYHFYISHFDDPHAEGTETIVVTATGLNNVFFSDQVGTNIVRFTIVDDDTPAAPKPQQGEQDAQPAQIETPSCVSDALLADVEDRIRNAGSPAGVERWTQVKNALTGQSNAITLAEVKTIHDRRTQNGWSTSQWDPVIEAMECLAAAPQEQPEQAEVQPATPATPELSLRAGSAVDEGGSAGFTVTADPAPQSDLTIAWTVAQSGEYLDAPGAGHRTVTLAAGATSVALSVATVDDAADEADGSVSVTLGAGTGYTVATGKGSATVAVRDNDEPVVRIAAGSGVTEGTSASFTVSASPVPAAPLDVTLSVGQSGDVAASGATGARTVTVPTAGSVTFEVATVDDGADEPDGSITATLGTGTGYNVAAGKGSATVTVRDNDAAAAASGPTISIADAAFKENQRTGYFTVTLSEPVDWPVAVHYATRDSTPVSAVAGQDYLAWQRSWRLPARFNPGETETRIYVRLYNDSHDEDAETFEMVLFEAEVNGPPGVSVAIADGVAVGTITNTDPMPAAWLSRFGRTTAEQALDGIAGRIAAQRSAGMEGTLAGRSLSFAPGAQSSGGATGATPGTSSGNDPLAHSAITGAFGDDGFGHRAAPAQTLTMREALLGSHFTATGGTDASGGSVALWGRAAQSRFDGHEGSFSLDGEATTAMLGADYARGHWLVGTALMQSAGEGGYANTDVTPRAASQTCPEGVEDVVCSGAVREGDGEVEASLTAAVPYAALEASERLKVWGAAGYGSGEVTLKPAMGGALTSDITWTMAAAGVRSALLGPPRGEGSGLALALTSDALWARTSSEKTHELSRSDSDVTRLRLGLEGSWRAALEGGGHFTPKLEAGMRHDGGDAETGFGVELGGGLAWSAPGLGLNLDVSGRTLLAHDDDDLEDRGFAASMAFDPSPGSERGPSFSLGQSFGAQAQGGLDALFAVDPLEDRASEEAQSRWTAEAAYGFAAFGGRFTASPHAGVGLTKTARDYTLGWRLAPAANTHDLSFGVRATRRESDAASPEHIIGLEAAARW